MQASRWRAVKKAAAYALFWFGVLVAIHAGWRLFAAFRHDQVAPWGLLEDLAGAVLIVAGLFSLIYSEES